MAPNDNNEFERKSSFLNLYLTPLSNRHPSQNQKKYINAQSVQKREYGNEETNVTNATSNLKLEGSESLSERRSWQN